MPPGGLKGIQGSLPVSGDSLSHRRPAKTWVAPFTFIYWVFASEDLQPVTGNFPGDFRRPLKISMTPSLPIQNIKWGILIAEAGGHLTSST
jgi:hypothetical protein